jgi:hypothetical protein
MLTNDAAALAKCVLLIFGIGLAGMIAQLAMMGG